MGEKTVIMAVAVVAMLLLLLAIRQKSHFILNLILRMILGTLCIYGGNQSLLWLGIDRQIGINTVTVLTSAILGFPGVMGLYGILFYKMLY